MRLEMPLFDKARENKNKTPRSRATSLARATVDVPARFRNSKSVGAVFGLTPSKYQSGEINRTGSISRCGDEMMRVMLYEAAQSMLQYCSRM
jgi:transposase